jgi:Domain of unknown function (DUF1793)
MVSRQLRFNSGDARLQSSSCLLTTVSTDDFAGALANQTNLALKAILGINAMGKIAELTGNTKDAEEFNDTSYKYMNAWEGYAFEHNSTHAKLAYQLNDSWGPPTFSVPLILRVAI